jgi:hypothetical protein
MSREAYGPSTVETLQKGGYMCLRKLEELQSQQHAAMIEKNEGKCPERYRKRAERDFKRLQKELDKIYAMYARIADQEERLCKKWGIELT